VNANLKPWKPGQSGNPNGSRKIPEDLKGVMSLTQTEICKIVSKYGRMSAAELTEALQDKSVPVIQLAICSIFMKSIQLGDYTRLQFLLERAIGRAPTVAEQDGSAFTVEELFTMLEARVPKKEVG
jgi:hypothetical protein